MKLFATALLLVSFMARAEETASPALPAVEAPPPPEQAAVPNQSMIREMRKSVADIALKHGAPPFAFVFTSDKEMGRALAEQLRQAAPVVEMEAVLADRRQKLAALDAAVAAKTAEYNRKSEALDASLAAQEAGLKKRLDATTLALVDRQQQLSEMDQLIALAKSQKADADAGSLAAQSALVETEAKLGIVQAKLARFSSTAGQIAKLMGGIEPGTLSASALNGTPLTGPDKTLLAPPAPAQVIVAGPVSQEVFGEE